MRKITRILLPLLIIPYLSSCGNGGDNPPPPVSIMYHLKVIGDHHCYVQGSENAIYEEDFDKDRTDITIPLFVQDKYEIDESQCIIPEGISLNNNLLVIAKMDQDYEVTIKSNHIEGYWFEFKGESCEIENSAGEFVSELKEFIQIDGSEEGKTYQLNLVNATYIPIGEIQPGVIISEQSNGYSLKLETIDRNYNVSLTAYNDNNLDMFLKIDLSDMIVPIYYFYCAGTNVSVDWGDGSSKSTDDEGYFSHTYSEPGVHKIFITSDGVTSFSFLEDPYLLETYLLNDISSISDYAFYECQNLNSVIITSNITSIGNSAFYNCASISNINFPDSITEIKDSAFYNCSKISAVVFPNSLKTIAARAFYNCTEIPAVIFPDSLQTIGNEAFCNCSKLNFIEFPTENNLFIGDSAFYGCAVKDVIIPKNALSIGVNPFAACYSLRRIRVDADNPKYECPNEANVIIRKDDRYLITGCYLSRIPNTIYTIGRNAFYGCWNLADVHLPLSTVTVDTAAFMSCENLGSVTIPNSVTSIGGNAFALCYKLIKVDLTAYLDPNNLPSSSVGMFLYTHKDLILYVKNNEMKEAFSKSGFWADYRFEVA